MSIKGNAILIRPVITERPMSHTPASWTDACATARQPVTWYTVPPTGCHSAQTIRRSTLAVQT